MCATDRLHSCFRQAEVLDLTFLNQVLHRPRHVFDWHVRVNTVLIEQVDGIDLESLKRALGDLLDVFWPTIQGWGPPHPSGIELGIEVEAELGGYHHLSTKGGEGFADEFFVCERAVNFSGVEECYAAFHRCVKKRDHLLLVCRRPVGKAHSHAAEPDSRDFQVAISKFALLHCVSFQERGTSLSVAARASGLTMWSMMLAAYRWYFVP